MSRIVPTVKRSAPPGASRLSYLDWARGLAVLVMIHVHAVLAWTAREDHDSPIFGYTRLIGGYPGALFLFLSGLAAYLFFKWKNWL